VQAVFQARLQSGSSLNNFSAGEVLFPGGEKKKSGFFREENDSLKKGEKIMWVMNAAVADTDNCMKSFAGRLSKPVSFRRFQMFCIWVSSLLRSLPL